MYRITFDENAQFRAFLTVNEASNVEVILSEKQAKFIINSDEVFARVIGKSIRALSDTDLSFRVSRSLLSSMFKDGALEIEEADGKINIDFYNAMDKLVCSVLVDNQTVFPSMFEYKERILSEGLGESFNSDCLKELNTIALNTGSYVNVCAGIASVVTKSSTRIYLPVDVNATFAITPKAYSILRKCSALFYLVKEYVCSWSKNFLIMVKTVRVNYTGEYSSICGPDSPYRSRYVADVDLSNLLSFFTARKVNAASLFVDINTKKVVIDCDTIVYSIPIEFRNEKCGNGYVFSGINIPASVIRSVLMYAGNNYHLLKKDEFIMLRNEKGMVVVFS